MFTGIVKTTGKILKIKPTVDGRRFMIDSSGGAGFSVQTGASVALDGVCLTAENSGSQFFAAVSSETIERSTLGTLKKGDSVNLEPSLKVGDEIGGHFVSGHVDSTGMIENISRRGDYFDLAVSFPGSLRKFIAEKGSIALDGISLTVNEVRGESLLARIVPHTYENTTLNHKNAGSKINIEVDIFARYIDNLTNDNCSEETLTFERLKAAGF